MSKDKGKLVIDAYKEYEKYVFKRRKKQGFETARRSFKNHILPYFQNRVLDSLSKKDIIEWQNKILDKNFSNTFNKSLYYYFSSFVKFCILNEYMKENIVIEVGNFKNKNEVKKYDYYTPREFRRFRKYIENFIIKQFFTFIFFNGTRPGETMALRFCDLEGNYAHIQHNIQRRGKRELDTPKNQSSIRYIKLSWLQRFRIFLLKCYYLKHSNICPDEYYIFGGSKPLSSTTIDRYKEKACKKANMRVITQHQFRHSYATNNIHNGISIDDVSQSLGHSKVSMTVDTYLHTRKGVPRTPRMRLYFFETARRSLKKLSQYIITRFIV